MLQMKSRANLKLSVQLAKLLGSISLLSLLICLEHVIYLQHRELEQPIQANLNSIRSTADCFVWSTRIQDWLLTSKCRLNDERDTGVSCIWPEDCKQDRFDHDRIVDQLNLNRTAGDRMFKIYLDKFIGEPPEINDCPVNQCKMVNEAEQADVLIFPDSVVDKRKFARPTRASNQIWIAYLLESPVNTFDRKFRRLDRGGGGFNWTANYRSDSDLVTPYAKFVPYEEKLDDFIELLEVSRMKSKFKANLPSEVSRRLEERFQSAEALHKELIKMKAGKATWFVSNCYAKNDRLQYSRSLSKYIQVDTYGKCGNLTCDKRTQSDCLNMVNTRYKFYLAFENSNCHQYITEKLYRNAMNENDPNFLVLPIVMGASREDYERFAPPGSYLHVEDYESVEELATHLRVLDQDDALFYSYFSWRNLGRFIDTRFLCRVCALMHESYLTNKIKSYTSIEDWSNSYTDDQSHSLIDSCVT